VYSKSLDMDPNIPHSRRDFLNAIVQTLATGALISSDTLLTHALAEATQHSPKGTLILVGGGMASRQGRPLPEDETEARKIYDEYGIMQRIMREAAAQGREVVVVTSGSETRAEENAREYEEELKRLGAQKVYSITNRDSANNQALASKIRNGDIPLVFLSGGDQMKLVSEFKDTPVCNAMLDALKTHTNFVIGANSAGTAAAATCMIGGDDNYGQEGLGLTSWIIDQHIDRVRRGTSRGTKRMEESMNSFPQYFIACGLPEGVAVKVTPAGISAFGRHEKTVKFIYRNQKMDMPV
jgi:hypothetical protein